MADKRQRKDKLRHIYKIKKSPLWNMDYTNFSAAPFPLKRWESVIIFVCLPVLLPGSSALTQSEDSNSISCYTSQNTAHPPSATGDLLAYFLAYFPQGGRVYVFVFENSGKEDRPPEEYSFEDRVPVHISDGSCEVDFWKIYQKMKHMLEQDPV